MRARSPRGRSVQVEVVDRLAKRFGKYALVAGVAKRAHDLKERTDSALVPSGGKLIIRAISEIARGEVRLHGAKSEEQEPE